jgi:hypothetical protein
VLTSSFWDDRLAWYYNDLPGSGTFLGPQDISLAMDATTTVATADVDGDGDLDVLGTDIEDVSNKAVWFPNDGLGTLGEPVPISLHAVGTRSLFPRTFDGDGDRDVAFNVEDFPGFIVWQENTTGLGDFGVVHTVTDQVKAAFSISGGDLDGDGDVDLLSASQDDDKIAWYRNTDGLGTFGPQLVLSTSFRPRALGARLGLDGDGDLDVLGGLVPRRHGGLVRESRRRRRVRRRTGDHGDGQGRPDGARGGRRRGRGPGRGEHVLPGRRDGLVREPRRPGRRVRAARDLRRVDRRRDGRSGRGRGW